MVGAELLLEAVRCHLSRDRHHAGVVDQQIELRDVCVQAVGESADRRERGEVERAYFYSSVRDLFDHPRPRGLTPRSVTAAHDDACAGPGELARRHQTEPAVGAGDDCYPARLARNIPSAPLRHYFTGRLSRTARTKETPSASHTNPKATKPAAARSECTSCPSRYITSRATTPPTNVTQSSTRSETSSAPAARR